MFPVFEIMAFEHVAGNSLNYGGKTCDMWQSRCYETVLKIQTRLTEMLSSSISLWLMGN